MAISGAAVNFTEWHSLRIYLDHNATTPLCPEARDAMVDTLAVVGNPSSIHEEGREARDRVETARRDVAALFGASPSDVVFTSGGTEADCLGMIGLARFARARGRPARVLLAAIEHPAVLGAAEALVAEGFATRWIEVNPAGQLDTSHFEALCREGASVAAIALANHELGTVQDMQALGAIAETQGVLVHCDAVQAAGKLELSLASPGAGPLVGANVASVAISGHKIYGPKGVGALWVRHDIDLGPLVPAGHQERERRPGTENLPGIAGLGAAARRALRGLASEPGQIATLARMLEDGLVAMPAVRIHGAGAPRVGNTVNAGFDGALGQAVVAALDLAGFAASTGAACTSGSVAPSGVLLALGLDRRAAEEAVRFSLGRDTRAADIEAVLAALPAIVFQARRFR